MAKFDPYRIWLGIPPEEQPPNHYRLLGVGLFESNHDAISNAADRQMVHLRSLKSGRKAAICQQLLNEVSAARLCLLDPRQKAAYDANLRRTMKAVAALPLSSAAVPPPPGNTVPPAPPQTVAAPPVPPPQVSPPPPSPPVQTGVKTFPSTARPTRYGPRRRKSAMPGVLITLGAILAVLLLAAWGINNSRSQRPAGKDRSNIRANGSGRSNGSARSLKPKNGRKNGLTGRRRRTADRDYGEGPFPVSGLAGDDLPDPDGNFRLTPAAPADEADPIGVVEGLVPEEPEDETSGVEVPPVETTSDGIESSGPVAVPEVALWRNAESRLREKVYAETFQSATNLTERSSLVRKLIDEDAEAQDDPASTYAVLEIARSEATRLGDAELALGAVEKMAERYQIPVLDEKLKTLDSVAASAKGASQSRVLAKKAVDLMKEAGEAEDADAAERLVGLAREHAEKARDRVLGKQVAEQSHATMLKLFGGGAEAQAALDSALQWLAKHQASDGGWNFKHGAPRRGETSPDQGTTETAPNAATALTLLAFLGSSPEPRQGMFRKNVTNGLGFLRRRLVAVGPDVLTLTEIDAPRMPSHALGTLAFCEMYRLGRDKTSGKVASALVNFLCLTQNKDGGWALKPNPGAVDPTTRIVPGNGQGGAKKRKKKGNGDKTKKSAPSDGRLTAWNLLALAAARGAGIAVPEKTTIEANSFLTHSKGMTKSDSDLAMLARGELGLAGDRQEIAGHADTLSASGPLASGDFLTNYCRARLVRRFGDGAGWKAFNDSLRERLLKTQAKDAPAAGSWFSTDATVNREGGRLFCTALGALSLEAYMLQPAGSTAPEARR